MKRAVRALVFSLVLTVLFSCMVYAGWPLLGTTPAAKAPLAEIKETDELIAELGLDLPALEKIDINEFTEQLEAMEAIKRAV